MRNPFVFFKRKHKKSNLIWVLCILSTSCIALYHVTFFLFDLLKNSDGFEGVKNIEFSIPKNAGVSQIVQKLDDKKLTKYPSIVELYLKTRLFAGAKLYHGTYRFSREISFLNMIELFLQGKTVPDVVKITIPEGYNIYNIANLLQKKKIIQYQSELLQFKDTQQLIQEFNLQTNSLEGYLYPDTYFFNRNKPLRFVLRKTLKTFWDNFPKKEYEQEKNNINLSIPEVIILASLIQKESGNIQEMPLISSVFHNRLKLGMKLDCDPTIIYGLMQTKQYFGKLSKLKGHLRLQSAYNTYLNVGLPPTPIANPGKNAILAALYPKKTTFLFFVAKNHSQHSFATTLKEHNNNVQKYKYWLYSKKKHKTHNSKGVAQ